MLVVRVPFAAKQIVAFMPGQPFEAKQAGGAAAKGGGFAAPGCRDAP